MTEQITGLVAEQLSLVVQSQVKIVSQRKLSGGSINQVYLLLTDKGNRYCCKLNLLQGYAGMFEAEAAGLELLRQVQAIRVPRVISAFTTETHQVLLLEWIGGKRVHRKFGTLGNNSAVAPVKGGGLD